MIPISEELCLGFSSFVGNYHLELALIFSIKFVCLYFSVKDHLKFYVYKTKSVLDISFRRGKSVFVFLQLDSVLLHLFVAHGCTFSKFSDLVFSRCNFTNSEPGGVFAVVVLVVVQEVF